MAHKRRDPFEVKISAEAERELTDWLAMEIENGLQARAALIGPDGEIDYWHKLYEGGDRTIVKNTPWPGAANLTSYIGTEKVDALRARIVKTALGVEPVWVVEGWGKSAARAPFVEEFHQWKLEEERLQSYVGRWVHNGLIETVGVLECYEGTERRRVRREMEVLIELNEQGGPILDERGRPVLARDEDGKLIPSESTDDRPSARAIVDDVITVRRGPRYRIIPVRDFLMLPGHAIEYDDVWGWGKRFYRRMADLREREKQGYYKNVDDLGGEGERNTTPRDTRSGQDVAMQLGPTAEKELWEILFLRDLDGDDIEEWYIATLHAQKRVMLRLQYDDLGRSRFLTFRPYQRSDSVWGYSLIGHKLGTIIEEHTVTRNQIADRSALVNSAPIKRVQGALWDPQEQPFGPRAIIDVRDPNEVQPMVIPDVPASLLTRERESIAAAERVGGVNDIASGVLTQVDRTLGEVQLATEQSFVRMEEMIRNFQEAMEELWQLRHIYWIRALEEQDEEPPQGVMESLAIRGLQLENGNFTANLLRGNFRGKPRGSVETADLNRLRADFNAFLAVVSKVPAWQQKLANPAVEKALWEQAVRLYRFPNKQAMLGIDANVATMESTTEGGGGAGNGAEGAGGAGGPGGLGGVAALLRALPGGLGTGGVSPSGPGGAGAGPELPAG